MRLRIDLAYDGTDFHGWAAQPGLRTVQGELEHALCTALRVPGPDDLLSPLVVAGRTDAGVHARAQVCHLDVPHQLVDQCVGHMDVPATQALQRRLTHLLPEDIAIHRVSAAPSGFDARFSALERTYVYRIADDGAPRDPLLRHMVLWVEGMVEIRAMNAAIGAAVGLHDFGSFATPNPGGTTIREVKRARWSRAEDGTVQLSITADAFAHNMVRSLVNASIRVGLGRQTPEWFHGRLRTPRREGLTGPAQARGLVLEEVRYPPDNQLASRAEAIRARRTLPPARQS